jgi:hypothetical protein
VETTGTQAISLNDFTIPSPLLYHKKSREELMGAEEDKWSARRFSLVCGRDPPDPDFESFRLGSPLHPVPIDQPRADAPNPTLLNSDFASASDATFHQQTRTYLPSSLERDGKFAKASSPEVPIITTTNTLRKRQTHIYPGEYASAPPLEIPSAWTSCGHNLGHTVSASSQNSCIYSQSLASLTPFGRRAKGSAKPDIQTVIEYGKTEKATPTINFSSADASQQDAGALWQPPRLEAIRTTTKAFADGPKSLGTSVAVTSSEVAATLSPFHRPATPPSQESSQHTPIDLAACPTPECTALVPSRLYKHQFRGWRERMIDETAFNETVYITVGAFHGDLGSRSSDQNDHVQKVVDMVAEDLGFDGEHIGGCDYADGSVKGQEKASSMRKKERADIFGILGEVGRESEQLEAEKPETSTDDDWEVVEVTPTE